MAKIKKWHIASAVAIIAILALIVVLVYRRMGSRLDAPAPSQCPAIPIGDPLTSYTQSSNCVVTCMTTDMNANVMQDTSGACRSACKPSYVKSLTTGECNVSAQASQSTIDGLKLQLLNITEPLMKKQLSDQIMTLQMSVNAAKSSQPMAR